MKLPSQICSDKEKEEHRQETLDIPEERSSNSENDLSKDKFHSAKNHHSYQNSNQESHNN